MYILYFNPFSFLYITRYFQVVPVVLPVAVPVALPMAFVVSAVLRAEAVVGFASGRSIVVVLAAAVGVAYPDAENTVAVVEVVAYPGEERTVAEVEVVAYPDAESTAAVAVAAYQGGEKTIAAAEVPAGTEDIDWYTDVASEIHQIPRH